ncbi:MAG TPA: hypothetical protein VG410_03130 [Solirubrobacteraceae bacterium]|nr:hypothetical protein [Solirubrobacteraceae bacterium]
MNTRDIRTGDAHLSCNVCGRTLLRGERAEPFLDGATRKTVCELCTSRAINEGWVREGSAPALDGRESSGERRRSLLGKLRARRDAAIASAQGENGGPEVEAPSRARVPAPARELGAAPRPRREIREPRHVRAVPTSGEQRVAAAVEMFNGSEHPRTIAGVARSLGAPTISVLPSPSRPSVVNVTASWELCWYRYEVDLSDELPSVRVAGQGYELDELPAEERAANAVADQHGALALG